jgi:hypothetical protein
MGHPKKQKISRKILQFKNVFLTPDETKMQRQQGYELRKELRGRREKGETDLVIKHGKIQPSKN